MKTAITILFLILSSAPGECQTAGEWVRQKETQKKYLVEQIAAYKIYLDYIKKGYGIVDKGLNAIGVIKEDDRSLHRIFLASLKTTNSKIKNSVRVKDIIYLQLKIMQCYKAYGGQLARNHLLGADENDYIKKVYSNLISSSILDVDDLVNLAISTGPELTDDERLKRIEAVYERMQDKYQFVKAFADGVKILSVQRLKDKNDVFTIRDSMTSQMNKMKKMIAIFLLLHSMSIARLSAQTEEVQQLLLNVEKLAQLKQILADLKKGYTIISTGYNTIKDISEGNFSLHKNFLDGLMSISPVVKKYRKVAEIINLQFLIVNEYKSAFKRFRIDRNFNLGELHYLESVYSNLINHSIKNLDALVTIVTANKLRMSDDERLKAIDAIFHDMQDKVFFLRDFNSNISLLAIQRAKEANDSKSLKNLSGIK